MMTSHAGSPHDQSDVLLLARMRSGDTAALDLLLEQYWAPLVTYSGRLLNSHDMAEDVVQEAFIRLWEHRERWSLEGSVRALLYKITRNVALDERKRLLRRQARVAAGRREAAPTVATPADHLEGAELRRAVEAAIAALPPRRREVFILARYDGLPYKQIAEVMEISPQTVANQFSRALDDLRRSLASFVQLPGEEGASPRRSNPLP